MKTAVGHENVVVRPQDRETCQLEDMEKHVGKSTWKDGQTFDRNRP